MLCSSWSPSAGSVVRTWPPYSTRRRCHAAPYQREVGSAHGASHRMGPQLRQTQGILITAPEARDKKLLKKFDAVASRVLHKKGGSVGIGDDGSATDAV